jgi:hypothetical protein
MVTIRQVAIAVKMQLMTTKGISRIPYLLRIHHMFSPIYFTNFFHEIFSVSAVEKENKLLNGPRLFFFSLPVEK